MALRINPTTQKTEVVPFLDFVIHVQEKYDSWDRDEVNIPFIRCEDEIEEYVVKTLFDGH